MPKPSITNTTPTDTGLLGCHYVYSLIFQEEPDDPLYVKIGMSSDPVRRFDQIRGNNPLTPRTLAWITCGSHLIGARMEKLLLNACHRWRRNGEWFKVSLAEFAAFKATCNSILKAHAPRGGLPPYKWYYLDPQEIIDVNLNVRRDIKLTARNRIDAGGMLSRLEAISKTG